MIFQTTYFHCGRQLKDTLSNEIGEIERAIHAVQWSESFVYGNADSC